MLGAPDPAVPRSSGRTHGVGRRRLLPRGPGNPRGRPRPRDALRSRARADAAGLQGRGPVHLPAGCRRRHRATARRASMSAQCWRGCPEAQEPSSTLLTGSAHGQHQIHALGRSRQRCRRRGRKTAVSLALSEVPPHPLLQAAHLDLAEGHKEGEGLLEVRGSHALPGRRLSLLPLPLVQHGLDLHVGVWARERGQGASQV